MGFARFDELVSKLPVQPDAQADIFFWHTGSVANGYTFA